MEIHDANGYLIHQFISEHSNHRTDEYGGSIVNFARFAIEVAKVIVDKIGAERTGIRISPGVLVGGVDEGVSALDVYHYLVPELENITVDIDAGLADITPVGAWALANPDLVERLKLNDPLNEPDKATFYDGDSHGYTDYPTIKDNEINNIEFYVDNN